MRQKISTFQEAVSYLYGVPKFAAKNSPEDTREFLNLLGNPDRKMKIIHVAGTNGKGSVCAYLSGILREEGYTCAVFTSPHLVDIRERFRIDGEPVSRENFLDAFLKVYGMIGEPGLRNGYHPSFFEFLFFMAMILFSKPDGTPVTDYVILETGLGGRLDATNSVSRKELSVITEIGMDHMEYLGDTIEKIAVEKAGIIKPSVPVVFWDDESPAAGVIRKTADRLKSPCFCTSGKDIRFSKFQNKTIDFSWNSRYYGYIGVRLGTTAFYQIMNASLAIRAAEVLLGREHLTETGIRKGVEAVRWAGRMEEVLPDVYVDGAHNEDGIKAFLHSVSRDGCTGERYCIFSAVSDKEYEKMISLLFGSGLFRHVIFTTIQNSRALPEEVFLQAAETYGNADTEWRDDSIAALRSVLERRGKKDKVYIAGSLYLVGEVKQAIGEGVWNDQF